MSHLRLLAFSLSEMGIHCKGLAREITWFCLSSKKTVLVALLRIDYSIARTKQGNPLDVYCSNPPEK